MGFKIDYRKVDLDTFLEKLKNKYLVPSRRIIKEDIDNRFKVFKDLGIKNVEELFKTLKKKSSFNDLLNNNLLTEEYLTILLREVKSIQTKTTKLADFYILPDNLILKMEKMGIKNTNHIYDRILTKDKRKILAEEAGCEVTEIELLAKLCDLTRVQWVNHTFAIMLYQIGFDTLSKLQNADSEDLHKKVNELNKKENIFRGSISFNDIVICIEASKEVSIDTDFN